MAASIRTDRHSALRLRTKRTLNIPLINIFLVKDMQGGMKENQFQIRE
jgi:hypothetical protein